MPNPVPQPSTNATSTAPPSSSSTGPTQAPSSSSSSSQGIVKDSVPGRLTEFTGHTKKVHAVAWNCTGDRLASAGIDAVVRVWNPENKSRHDSLQGHRTGILSVGWHPSENACLASASNDKTVRFWDTRTCKDTGTVKTPGENLNMEWSHDGKMVAVANRVSCCACNVFFHWHLTHTHT